MLGYFLQEKEQVTISCISIKKKITIDGSLDFGENIHNIWVYTSPHWPHGLLSSLLWVEHIGREVLHVSSGWRIRKTAIWLLWPCWCLAERGHGGYKFYTNSIYSHCNSYSFIAKHVFWSKLLLSLWEVVFDPCVVINVTMRYQETRKAESPFVNLV